VGTVLGIWNPVMWQWDDLHLRVRESDAGKDVRGRWSVSNRQHGVSIGDRFFILKLGEDPRGIIASGTVVRLPFEDDHWDETPGKTTNYVEVDFDRLLDPANVLPVELLESQLPNTHWRPQGGGTSVSPADEADLEQLWGTHKS